MKAIAQNAYGSPCAATVVGVDAVRLVRLCRRSLPLSNSSSQKRASFHAVSITSRRRADRAGGPRPRPVLTSTCRHPG